MKNVRSQLPELADEWIEAAEAAGSDCEKAAYKHCADGLLSTLGARETMAVYRFPVDTEAETPLLSLLGCPSKLIRLGESGLVDLAEQGMLTRLYAAMLHQAISDTHPVTYVMSKASNDGEEDAESRVELLGDGKTLFLHVFGGGIREILWEGNGARLAREMLLAHNRIKGEEQVEPGLAEEREKKHDPEFVSRQIARMEELGLIELVEGGLKSRVIVKERRPHEGVIENEIERETEIEKETEKVAVISNKEIIAVPSKSVNPISIKTRGLKTHPPKRGHLSEKAKSELMSAEIDPNLIRYFDIMTGYSKALNASDPARGGVEGLVGLFTGKPGFEKRYKQWLKNHPPKC